MARNLCVWHCLIQIILLSIWVAKAECRGLQVLQVLLGQEEMMVRKGRQGFKVIPGLLVPPVIQELGVFKARLVRLVPPVIRDRQVLGGIWDLRVPKDPRVIPAILAPLVQQGFRVQSARRAILDQLVRREQRVRRVTPDFLDRRVQWDHPVMTV